MIDQEPVGPDKYPLDGPFLRAIRKARGATVRQVATAAGVTHPHLSKVERQELGRSVTPGIIRGYERVLHVKLLGTTVAERMALVTTSTTRWQPGQLSPPQQRALRGQIAAIAAGVDEYNNPARLRQCPLKEPNEVTAEQAATLQQTATCLEGLGDLAGAAAQHLLSWALRLPTDGPAGRQVDVARARLARTAALECERDGRLETARNLLILALSCAVAADDPDLRADALAALADQYVTLDHPDDALMALRMAEGDERVSGEVRERLKQVRLRAEQMPGRP